MSPVFLKFRSKGGLVRTSNCCCYQHQHQNLHLHLDLHLHLHLYLHVYTHTHKAGNCKQSRANDVPGAVRVTSHVGIVPNTGGNHPIKILLELLYMDLNKKLPPECNRSHWPIFVRIMLLYNLEEDLSGRLQDDFCCSWPESTVARLYTETGIVIGARSLSTSMMTI